MRVLMVCLGNICRSPIADGWLRQKSEIHQLNLLVDSAGTSNLHAGERPDSRMRKTALEYGVNIDDLRARQFIQEDFDRFDIIFAMDKNNLRDILKLARNKTDEQKVKLLLNEPFPNEDREVPDPYYGGQEGFNQVVQLLDVATNAFLRNYKLI